MSEEFERYPGPGPMSGEFSIESYEEEAPATDGDTLTGERASRRNKVDTNHADTNTALVDADRVLGQKTKGNEVLTEEEEMDLAKRYEAGRAAHALLGRAATNGAARRTPEQTKKLVQISQDGDKARKIFIYSNFGLVFSKANKNGKHSNRADRIQDAIVGLDRAVEKFDYTKGYKFSTYATWWIRQALDRSRQKTADVKIGDADRQSLKKIRDLEDKLLHEDGREPTEAEYIQETGRTAFDIARLLSIKNKAASLDKPYGEDGHTTLGATIIDHHAEDARSAENAIFQSEVQGRLKSAMWQSLTEREQTVIVYQYGLFGKPQLTQQQLSHDLEISIQRVQNLQRAARVKMKNSGLLDDLRDYLGSLRNTA
jgi:RNA polymerase sigma factor (sigma-70 family)